MTSQDLSDKAKLAVSLLQYLITLNHEVVAS